MSYWFCGAGGVSRGWYGGSRAAAVFIAALKRERAHQVGPDGLVVIIPGGDLLSHTAARAVSSALRGLTSVFEMGTGVTPSA